MCGIALIRLRKPFSYYVEKYETYRYGLKKLYLLMQKQHNRGQDGAGVANIKIDVPPGKRYISRYRSNDPSPIEDVFQRIDLKIRENLGGVETDVEKSEWVRQHVAFMGEALLGHLRYGTHGGNTLENCHPFLRQSNWKSRNLVLAGNFNMTNVDELFNKLIELGQHPKDKVDTVIVLEKIGHFLDEENRRFWDEYKDLYTREEISHMIEEQLDLQRVLMRACKYFDGGYSIAGITGYGAAFLVRDPIGIRPAYYYADDEVVVAASEKSAIKTAFNIEYSEIREINPGHALIIDKYGNYSQKRIVVPEPEKKSCSFERIYFSRGSDPIIYNERKALGELLCPQILKAVNYDLENTVFSYIPNTSETAFLGMIEGIEKYLIKYRQDMIIEGRVNGKELKALSPKELEKILSFRPRVEKLAIKDVKLRTFITDDEHRDDLVAHVYDTTYEVIQKKKDTIVLIDDSIVRGTTLEKSIIRMLDRLEPKKIIIVSSAPQIRFPDCYGIDMSKMGSFVAFRAVKALLEESGQAYLLDRVYEKCLHALESNQASRQNFVKELYDPFTDEDISRKISEIVKAQDVEAEVQVIFQTVADLHIACPNHSGDWYFTGDYPTPGGNIVVNKAFVNFMKGVLERAY
ncbi:MAG: amidophosphoribosyltransferase [Microscillaceae bacterium]|nr:amidophosphoribosyltransferase [Microscillaceae bacterium]